MLCPVRYIINFELHTKYLHDIWEENKKQFCVNVGTIINSSFKEINSQFFCKQHSSFKNRTERKVRKTMLASEYILEIIMIYCTNLYERLAIYK